ncbi:restriction endonuclease subunit S [Ruminococcus sp.]|jgi:type I restriction enzyme S subunit|uniref:restriction endonuclease subunit S n=1 Tax=Ruminococcus sp. TaxID=41978 RepID=UPI002633E4B0|nr:restriction endonuclease subunit S [Ruminococcus sp.]MDD6988943.1 restriction endonuclease subunit S [Ruminococcus sp.]MDY6201455.1 restriction endonuclease subunit S [Ruminococcus sp.]
MKCKLSDICSFRKGKVEVENLNAKNYISTENMLPNKCGITEASSLPTVSLTQEYNSGDVLVSNIRPYFKKIWQAEYDGGCSNDVLVFVPKPNTDKDFLYYVLADDDFFTYSMATSKGTKMPRGDKTSIMQYEVPLIDLQVQKKIASVLKALDERIKLNNEINNNLEQQAQAIFANEFLSLDTLPEGWKQASLIDIADYLNGLAMQKYRPTADESGIPVLKIKELRQGCCDDNSELCSPSIKSDYIIHDGDVIFSWSGSLLVDLWCGGICGLNQHLFKVTSSKYDKWFYYAWTKHHLDRFVAVAADKATTMGHIKRDELAKAEVLIPNEADYNRIGALLQPIYEMIISNRIENKKLAATRDTLLPKLMNGEIDMSEVDYE